MHQNFNFIIEQQKLKLNFLRLSKETECAYFLPHFYELNFTRSFGKKNKTKQNTEIILKLYLQLIYNKIFREIYFQ